MESKERDEKGRFVKGATPKGARPFNEGTAKEMGTRSAASRLAKKRGAELVRALLEQGVKDPKVREALKQAGFDTENMTNEIAMHIRQIEKAQKTGDTKAYSAVMKAAGYDTINVNHHADGPLVITQNDAEAVDKWADK